MSATVGRAPTTGGRTARDSIAKNLLVADTKVEAGADGGDLSKDSGKDDGDRDLLHGRWSIG